MAVNHIDRSNFDSETASGQVLVDFWATWCGPCRMQTPILEDFDSEMAGAVKVCKIDIDENPDVAQRFGVMSIPTLVAFRDGREISREIGVTSKEDLMLMFG